MPSSKPLRILYAEHDPGAAELFRRSFERVGHHVDLAADGEKALEMWHTGHYDVLCINQQMPKLTGLDVIRSLASDQEPPPIVLVTEAGDEKAAVEALKLGAYDCVVRDVAQGYLELLPAVIEMALERKRLLEEKQQAEQAVLQAREDLEIKVRERTAELAEAAESLKIEIAERTRAEKEARSEREFLQHVMESVTQPFYIIDAQDYTLMMANSAAGELNLATGKTCYEVTHGQKTPCEGVEHPCPVSEVRTTGKPVTVEHTHYNEKGEERAVEIHAYPILNEQGEVTQIIHYSQDITERKRVEENLRKRLETSANIMQNIPPGILVYQYQPPGELFLVNANSAACRILGISVEAWRGWELDEMWPDARRQGLTRAFLKAAQTGQTFRTENAIYKSEENDKTLTLLAFPLPRQMLGVFFEDVTVDAEMEAESLSEGRMSQDASEKGTADLAEAKKHIEILERQREWADGELRNALALSRSLCRRFPSGVLICDRDGELLEFNDRAVDLLGLPQVGASQRLKATDVAPLVDSGISRFLQDATVSGSAGREEFHLTHESGEEVLLRLSADPFSDSDGKTLGILVVIEHDTTEKPVEEEETSVTILVLSDSDPVSRILRKGLEKLGQTALGASSSDEAVEVLTQQPVSVIACDMPLDPSAGWETANQISTSCESYGIEKPPFLLITQSEDEPPPDKKTGQYGVDAQLSKPVDIPGILGAIRRLLRGRRKKVSRSTG